MIAVGLERHTLVCAYSECIRLVEDWQNEVAERVIQIDRER